MASDPVKLNKDEEEGDGDDDDDSDDDAVLKLMKDEGTKGFS